MKTEELREKGLTDDQISFVMAENGKDIGKIQKKLEDMTAEHDKEKQRADNAEETLKKFDCVDVEAIKTELADWQKKAKEAEADYKQKIADRDFDDSLRDAISLAGGLNPKAIKSLLDVDTLKASKNQKEDIATAINALTEADDSKMLFKSKEEDKHIPHFTTVTKGGCSSGIKSKKDIYAKDNNGRYLLNSSERQKALIELGL